MATRTKSVNINGDDLRLLIFDTEEELDKFSRLYLEEKKFVCISLTPLHVVPLSMIPLIKARGAICHIYEPVAESEVTPKQREDIKNGVVFWIPFGGVKFLVKRWYYDLERRIKYYEKA